uniref:Uncharacterized protein n=1 Tax=Ornithorhynchus anatinus TaxID=9258 RepID=F6XHA9_ORNAN
MGLSRIGEGRDARVPLPFTWSLPSPQDQLASHSPPLLPPWIVPPPPVPPPNTPPFWVQPPPRSRPRSPVPRRPPALATPSIDPSSEAGEDGSGGLHGGCLDSLRSLFDGPPCPRPGALLPFQAPGDPCLAPATPSGDPRMEEHLAVMHERLRQELPNLFLRSHDYTLYSSDVEFVNEILNMRTK